MADGRYIIKTDDGRYVKSGNNIPSNFARDIWLAKFYKHEDDAKRVVASAYRYLEKYGMIVGGSWPSEFTIVKVEMNEVETIPYK